MSTETGPSFAASVGREFDPGAQRDIARVEDVRCGEPDTVGGSPAVTSGSCTPKSRPMARLVVQGHEAASGDAGEVARARREAERLADGDDLGAARARAPHTPRSKWPITTGAEPLVSISKPSKLESAAASVIPSASPSAASSSPSSSCSDDAGSPITGSMPAWISLKRLTTWSKFVPAKGITPVSTEFEPMSVSSWFTSASAASRIWVNSSSGLVASNAKSSSSSLKSRSAVTVGAPVGKVGHATGELTGDDLDVVECRRRVHAEERHLDVQRHAPEAADVAAAERVEQLGDGQHAVVDRAVGEVDAQHRLVVVLAADQVDRSAGIDVLQRHADESDEAGEVEVRGHGHVEGELGAVGDDERAVADRAAGVAGLRSTPNVRSRS